MTARALALIASALLLAGVARADPAVWSVDAGESTDIWLLGSVHYMREQDYPLPDVVDALYARADELVMEIDLDDLDPAAVQTRFMQAALLPGTSTLAGVLDETVYASADTAARELGLDLSALARFEPWLVAVTLMDLGMARLGFSAERGLEQTLVRRAAADGKAIRGLESLTDQIRIFDELSLDEQQALLAQTLDEIDSPPRDMQELLSAWRAGRLDALAGRLFESFEDFPRLYETLVVERNRRWIDAIERLAEQPGRYLVVVGALHLVGDDNVVELLRARGRGVRRFALQ